MRLAMTFPAQHDAIKQRRIRSAPMIKFERVSSATPKQTSTVARRPPWVLMKEEGMNDRTKADKAWEARQEAARYRIFNAATNAAEATDEADDEKYFAVLDQAGNAAEAAAAEITGYKTYADLLEALDTRRKQSQGDEYGERRLHR
jgi:hypothetical protein